MLLLFTTTSSSFLFLLPADHFMGEKDTLHLWIPDMVAAFILHHLKCKEEIKSEQLENKSILLLWESRLVSHSQLAGAELQEAIGGALSTPIQTWLFSLLENPPSFVMVRYSLPYIRMYVHVYVLHVHSVIDRTSYQ